MIVLSNLEVLNANMIEDNVDQRTRLEKLNRIARKELEILVKDINVKETILNNFEEKHLLK